MKTSRPLYQQIRNYLAKGIAQGQYPPHTALPTIAELAQQFNTSGSTAACALNLLADEGLIRCRKGRPARVLPMQHNQNHLKLAISVGPLDYDYCEIPYLGASTIWTMQQYLIERLLKDHHAALNISGKEWEHHCDSIDGIILLRPQDYDVEDFDKLRELNIPFVGIETYLEQVPANNVVSLEMRGAMSQAAIRFLSCGVKTICTALNPCGSNQPTDNRFNDFFRTLNEQHFAPGNIIEWPALVNQDGSARSELLEQYVLPVLKTAPKPIGVLSCSDIFCRDLIAAARRCKLELKKDIFMIGCSGLPISAFTTPALTTVEMPFSKMIDSGVEMVYAQIENKLFTHPSILLNAKLTIRDT